MPSNLLYMHMEIESNLPEAQKNSSSEEQPQICVIVEGRIGTERHFALFQPSFYVLWNRKTQNIYIYCWHGSWTLIILLMFKVIQIIWRDRAPNSRWYPELFIYLVHDLTVNKDHQLFGYPHSSKYILCSAEEQNSYRFETNWGWVNDVHFWVNYSFKSSKFLP